MGSHGLTVPYAHSPRKCPLHNVAGYFLGMRTPAERLAQARLDAGCETAAEGADRVGVKYFTYVQHESGVRGISRDKASLYGRAFGVEPSWILYGRGKRQEGMVPVIGRVGANAEGSILFSTGQEGGELAPIPPGGSEKARALFVVGHSMRGLADDGALVYFEDQKNPPGPELLGYAVVLETDDGQVLLKRLLKGSSPEFYDLESINGPTLADARVLWAAEVTAIIPPRQARRIMRHHAEAA